MPTALIAGIDMIAELTGQTPTKQLFEPMTWAMYQEGKKFTASQYVRAKAVSNTASREMARFHQTYDVWITPTLARPPVVVGPGIATIEMDQCCSGAQGASSPGFLDKAANSGVNP